ncbi:MAG: DNA polymerase III subunit chi [Pseudomonadota bacterium]
MARVDFYILSAERADAAERFGCRLAEKAYRLQHRVHLRVADATDEQRLDRLLWTFRDGSFVPHEVLAESSGLAAVTIGAGDDLPDETDLLINLGGDMPGAAERVGRIAEIVPADPAARSASRRRYADYRDRGFELTTHTID